MTKPLDLQITASQRPDVDWLNAFLEPGPVLRIKPGAVEAAIARARHERAKAFQETIGALWRTAPQRPPAQIAA